MQGNVPAPPQHCHTDVMHLPVLMEAGLGPRPSLEFGRVRAVGERLVARREGGELVSRSEAACLS